MERTTVWMDQMSRDAQKPARKVVPPKTFIIINMFHLILVFYAQKKVNKYGLIQVVIPFWLLSHPGEFRCSHGRKCIPRAQVCDGRFQCRDHSDEVGCWEQTKGCQHRCSDGKRCIPKKFLCDGERDCLDGSDEVGCG